MNIFLFSLFQYNYVVFSKSAQIAFLNFKCHFHKIVTHASELCDIILKVILCRRGIS